MTCATNLNVPRESHAKGIDRSLLDRAKSFLTKRRLPQKQQRPIVLNHRLKELSPHLLNDIGFVDVRAYSKRK